MIDSVLKGTGNSRFLKSAVPPGTSWADALAMLQAGTFPIDFNGINTEGFQQVGTPLNKANLLKDATAAQIGLPPSTTPDGMFQALGNTGELHVWRKTTVSSEPVPAGYTLGDVLTHGSSYIACQINGSNYVTFVIQEATSITVNDNGTIEASWGSNISVSYGGSYTFTPNRFVKIVSINANAIDSNFVAGDVVWVPSDGKIYGKYVQQNDGTYLYYLEFTKCQKVNAYPLTPAGTTTTYPVSTNPKAYQEGDDKQSSGYTLGDVQTGSFSAVGPNTTVWRYSDSVTVDDNGNISLDNYGTISVAYSDRYVSDNLEKLRGKFAIVESRSSDNPPYFDVGVCYFFPADVVFTIGTSLAFWYCNKYQIATGYAAIPAGTTIEYLGKLGDKARVQVLSYVGTGTYGSSNQNSLTFDFVPKCVFLQCVDYGPYRTFAIHGARYVNFKLSESTSSQNDISWSSKTMSWFSTVGTSFQYNDSGRKYIAVAIG